MIHADIFSQIGAGKLSKKAEKMGLPRLIREGLPVDSAFALQMVIEVSNDELEKLIGVSFRTLRRNKEKRTRLSMVASDRLVRLLKVTNDAAETMGTQENGVAWMHRPCRPLKNQKPIELLDTEAGTSDVLDILGRIRHGVFS